MKVLIRCTIGHVECAQILDVSDDRVEADEDIQAFKSKYGARIREVVHLEGDIFAGTKVNPILFGGQPDFAVSKPPTANEKSQEV